MPDPKVKGWRCTLCGLALPVAGPRWGRIYAEWSRIGTKKCTFKTEGLRGCSHCRGCSSLHCTSCIESMEAGYQKENHDGM